MLLLNTFSEESAPSARRARLPERIPPSIFAINTARFPSMDSKSTLVGDVSFCMNDQCIGGFRWFKGCVLEIQVIRFSPGHKFSCEKNSRLGCMN